MNRRSLFGALALSPLMAVEAMTKEKPTGEPIPEASQIIIQGTKKGKPIKANYPGGGLSIFNMPETDPNKQISMAVGDDGNLWLKRKDSEWKRIVTE